MTKKYKHLLFDADNTLLDFNKAENEAFLALSALDSDVFNEKHYRLYHDINDSLWKALEKREVTKAELKILRFCLLYESLGVNVSDEKLSTIVNTYPKYLAQGTALIDGALDVIKELYPKYDIYIITNGLYDVQTARFNKSELKKYIKALFISEEIGYEKPDKNFFEWVINTVGDKNKSNYLVIGDSLSSDIDGALAFGFDSIYFDREGKGSGTRRPTITISSLRELLYLA